MGHFVDDVINITSPFNSEADGARDKQSKGPVALALNMRQELPVPDHHHSIRHYNSFQTDSLIYYLWLLQNFKLSIEALIVLSPFQQKVIQFSSQKRVMQVNKTKR